MKIDGFKTWFSAAELAELELPGLPRQKRKVNERAAKDGWALRTAQDGSPLARPRQVRGGGLEYHLDVLPTAARMAIRAAGVGAVADIHPAPPAASALWRWFEGASEKVKSDAKNRAATIALVEAYERAGLTRSAAVATAAARDRVSPATVWNWIALVDGVAPSDRLPYLAPQRKGGGAEAEVDAGAWQVLISDYLRPEKPTFSSCYKRLRDEYAAPRGIALPHEKTLRRMLDRKVDGRLIIARREGDEALRRTLPAQERTVKDLHALEAVNIDGHKFDVFCVWPDGRIGRPLMVACQDLMSRKMVAHRIDESETALSTRLVFADLFKRYGIPKQCVLDNGRAFASKAITGGAKSRFRFKIRDEEPTGILVALGVQIHWAMPFRGQSKPIERGFRDLCDTIAKRPEFAGAYTGNKPDAKPENYGSRAIPIADFCAIVDREMARHNAEQGRRTEMANGCSFDDVFNASYATAPIGKATPEQLRLALLAADDRTCGRQDGAIMYEGNRYYAAELFEYAGKKVSIRFDPDDLHSEIHVYDRTGKFIATAPVIEATGFFDKAAASKRRAQEAELRRNTRDLVKMHELLDAQQLAAQLPGREVGPATPAPGAARIVRHKGQTKGQLRAVTDARVQPSTDVVDRLAAAMDRVVLPMRRAG